MQLKLLKTLAEELVGPDYEKIVDILFSKKDVNEFLIAKKMDLTINQVRNILYKLSADGLVSHIRKKDKRKGWYIYYWTLNTKKCLLKLEETLQKKIKSLNEQLASRENKRFYVCKNCSIEVKEETALEHDFSCEECADVYNLVDNEKPKREIKTKISHVNREMDIIKEELSKINQKEAKAKVKREVKEVKEKKAERKAKRDKRIKDKIKEDKKIERDKGKKFKKNPKTTIKQKKINKLLKIVKKGKKSKKAKKQKKLVKKKVSKKSSKKK